MASSRERQRHGWHVQTLDRLPGCLVVVDVGKEYIAVKEANRLGIPIVGILDTDCDPTSVDFAIPGNDDAMRSVSLLLSRLIDAVVEGKANQRGAPADAAKTSVDPDIRSVRYRAGTSAERRAPRKPAPQKKVDEYGDEKAPARTVETIPSWEAVPGNDGRHPPHTRLAFVGRDDIRFDAARLRNHRCQHLRLARGQMELLLPHVDPHVLGTNHHVGIPCEP
jgi:hypothetical protein